MDSTPYYSVIFMFIASVIIAYFITMNVMISKIKHISNNLVKIYHSLFMGVLMASIEVLMFMLYMNSATFMWLLVLLVILCVILFFIIRDQVGVNEREFLLAMIEHHSMAIQMVDKTIDSASTPAVVELMTNIRTTQLEEIKIMENLLYRDKVTQ
jgi:hypothetical protein